MFVSALMVMVLLVPAGTAFGVKTTRITRYLLKLWKREKKKELY